MGSAKHGKATKGGPRRFPQSETKIRNWLREQYRVRGLTGPWQLTTEEMARLTDIYVSTVGSVMAAFARDGTEGVTQVIPGQYEYMPPRRVPTPADLARPAPQPTPQAQPAPAPPAAPRPPRSLDMTLRPRLLKYARDVWAREGKVTIVLSKQVATEIGGRESSTQTAIATLAREFPEAGYVRVGPGAYEIHRPRRIRPQRRAEEESPEEPGIPQEPEPVWPPEPAPAPGPVRDNVDYSSMSVAERPLGVPYRAAPAVVPLPAEAAPVPEPAPAPVRPAPGTLTWTLVPGFKPVGGKVLQQASDGTIWVAQPLELP